MKNTLLLLLLSLTLSASSITIRVTERYLDSVESMKQVQTGVHFTNRYGKYIDIPQYTYVKQQTKMYNNCGYERKQRVCLRHTKRLDRFSIDVDNYARMKSIANYKGYTKNTPIQLGIR